MHKPNVIKSLLFTHAPALVNPTHRSVSSINILELHINESTVID